MQAESDWGLPEQPATDFEVDQRISWSTVEVAILTCRWVGLRSTHPSQRCWLCRSCIFKAYLQRSRKSRVCTRFKACSWARYFGSCGWMALSVIRSADTSNKWACRSGVWVRISNSPVSLYASRLCLKENCQ
jgi:hypothetical protein